MTTQEIKQAILDGKNFENEAANWYTVFKPSENLYWIVIGDRDLFCKNLESATKRVKKLMNTGC